MGKRASKFVFILLITAVLLIGCTQNDGTRTVRSIESGKTKDGMNTVSEVVLIQPESSNVRYQTSINTGVSEKDGIKTVTTVVTIEEIGLPRVIPYYVWILVGLLVLLTIITIVACTGKKEEVKPEPEPQPEPEPVVVPEPVIMPVAVEEPVEESKKAKKKLPRFFGIDSLQDRIVITKNTAKRADELKLDSVQRIAEIKEINAQIKEENPARVEMLKEIRSNKNAILKVVIQEGKETEKSNDDYAYLLEKITGEPSDFRKTERFAQKNIDIVPYDVTWLKKHLGLQ